MNKAWMLAAALVAAPASAETLADAVAAAFASNPGLAAARARQQALAETPEQARALGRLTAEAAANGGYDELAGGETARGSLSANLSIITGGRVSSAVRVADSEVAAGDEAVRDAEAAVLERVVSAYAELLFNQQAVEVARVDIALLDRQVAEARSRFDLGQATRTDVAQLEAQRASVAATLADAEGALLATAAAYRAVVGRDPGVLDTDIAAPVAMPATLAEARDAALDGNPLLRQRARLVDAGAARIDRERAEGNPLVTLGGIYGRGALGDRSVAFTQASLGATLRVPLLTGGLVAARVREAAAAYRADRFDAEDAARLAIRDAEAAWARLDAAAARERANAVRVEAADVALRGVRAEYAFALRTTLDILVADESLRFAQLALARSRSDRLLAQAALLRATGRLDGDSFATPRPFSSQGTNR